MNIANDPFTLFCLYYLGLTPEGEVKFFNANQIAKRYNWSVGELMTALEKHDLHPDKVLNTDFPLSRYQIDFQMATEGVSTEVLHNLAEVVYQRYRQSEGKKRDWLEEIKREKGEMGDSD